MKRSTKKIPRYLIVFLLLTTGFIPFFTTAQPTSREYKLHYDEPPLFITERGDTSRIGFVGGLHSAQFNNLDLNLDGIPDLVIFDEKDYELLTFLAVTKNGNTYFEFAPDYAEILPQVSGWLIITDFNGDGKQDIFGGNGSGVVVYKNVSSSTHLRFEMYNKELSYFDTYSNNYFNVAVSPHDYPAIRDIDNDGDLDIIAFDSGAENAFYYKNLSMELYGHTDSFVFDIETHCFGMFRIVSNFSELKHRTRADCYLDDNNKRKKHTGKSLLALDVDDDGDMDLLLSDAYSTKVNLLFNGRNPNSTEPKTRDSIESAIMAWPKNTKSIDVVNFPCMTMVDVNFDGLPDLLVSPKDFESDMITPNIWYYKNVGTIKKPVFQYIRTGFVDGDGIDIGTYSNPFLFDYDGDGDLDLFVSGPKPYTNYLYDEAYYQISYYENVGTSTKAIYKLKTEDWMGFSSLKEYSLMLAFGDVDNNGTQDMLVGLSNGDLMCYTNNQNPDKQANFSLSSAKYQNINAGGYAAPFLYDMTGNGLNDLFIGNKKGFVQYWENTNGTFLKKTDSIGGVFVGTKIDNEGILDGHAVPIVVNLDDDKRPELLVSSVGGELFVYTNIEVSQTAFNLDSKPFLNKVANRFENRVLGSFLSLALGDLNGDDIPDVMLGNQRGGIYFFSGSLELKLDEESKLSQANISIYPNPSNGCVSIHLPEFEQECSLEIYTIQGKKMQTLLQSSTEQQHDISFLPNGLYLVQVFQNGFSIGSKKISIQTY